MKTVSVKTSEPYEVLIEHGLLDRSGEIVAAERAEKLLDADYFEGELIAPGKLCIVTDRRVEAQECPHQAISGTLQNGRRDTDF